MEPSDAALDQEFAFSTWQGSCRDPYPTMQECRRVRDHKGDHAAGYGANRVRWPNVNPA